MIKSYLQDRKRRASIGRAAGVDTMETSAPLITRKEGWQAAKQSQPVHGECACRKSSGIGPCSVDFILTVFHLYSRVPSGLGKMKQLPLKPQAANLVP